MTLVAIDGQPLIAVGAAHVQGSPVLQTFGSMLLDAVNEAAIMYGQIITEDGASHTIDTTGSSSIGWRSGTLTFANAGTTAVIGIAALDTANGPPARAVNVADVITFDVFRSIVGGSGGITANAWQVHVPTSGTKTIANGDQVALCIQVTARGGTDAVRVQTSGLNVAAPYPNVTPFTGAAYSTGNQLPNAVITFSDGKLGFFYGGFVASTSNNQISFNNTSSPKEYGNLLQFPFPVRVYGAFLELTPTGDSDVVLYSDPLGTPVAQRTTSLDLNVVSAVSAGDTRVMFSSPYDVPANTPVAIISKPTSASSIVCNYITLFSSAHQKAWNNGVNGYAVNRASGAFAAQNSNKDRFATGLLVGAFDAGGGGGAAGMLYVPGLEGV